MDNHSAHEDNLNKSSITLLGGVAMGTGVMIGAGIFALTGQIAELAGPLFPLSFVAGALITALASYSYITMSNAWPSSGGWWAASAARCGSSPPIAGRGS